MLANGDMMVKFGNAGIQAFEGWTGAWTGSGRRRRTSQAGTPAAISVNRRALWFSLACARNGTGIPEAHVSSLEVDFSSCTFHAGYLTRIPASNHY